MKTWLPLILVIGTFTSYTRAYPQGLVMLDSSDSSSDHMPPKETPTRRPYSPLPPMHLPPHFQSVGMTLPPPSAPLHIQEYIPSQYHLGLQDRFFFNFLAQLKPMLFPWLRSTTTLPPQADSNESQEGSDEANDEEGSDEDTNEDSNEDDQ